jgi:hypothetical protein
MRIGIVKEKYNKKIRWFYYVIIPLLLLVSYPILMTLNLEIGLVWILFALLCIISFVLIHKIVDDIIIIGEMEIDSDKFKLKLNNQETPIPFDSIKMVLLKPKLGFSRVAHTFKVYECQIKTHEDYYRFDVTREEVENGDIVAKNILNPKAFDLIKFLKRKNINYRIEQRVY